MVHVCSANTGTMAAVLYTHFDGNSTYSTLQKQFVSNCVGKIQTHTFARCTQCMEPRKTYPEHMVSICGLVTIHYIDPKISNMSIMEASNQNTKLLKT